MQTAIDITAPVIAVDGKVYAKLPVLVRTPRSTPAQYGAPDPADLMGTDSGISSLLPETQGATSRATPSGTATAVLTEITGTFPAEAVQASFPPPAPRTST